MQFLLFVLRGYLSLKLHKILIMCKKLNSTPHSKFLYKMAKILDKIKEYFIILVSFIAGATLLILQFFGASKLWIFLVALISLLIIFTEQILTKKKTKVEEAERKLTDNRIIVIEKEVIKKNTELEDKQKIILEFLKEGIIKEEDLIESLKQEPFVILYHFHRGVLKELRPFLPEGKRAINRVLNELGFVPVGPFHGSYFFHVVGTNLLPAPLNNLSYLEAYIRKKVRKSWSQMLSNVEKQDKQLYDKIKDKKILNLSYFLGKLFPSNLSVGYINFSSFDRDFISYYSKFTNVKELQINEQKLNELLKLASLKLFIVKIPPKDRKKILNKEKEIKERLEITNLLDYESITEEQWNSILSKIFKKEMEDYAKIIKFSVNKYCPIIREFL